MDYIYKTKMYFFCMRHYIFQAAVRNFFFVNIRSTVKLRWLERDLCFQITRWMRNSNVCIKYADKGSRQTTDRKKLQLLTHKRHISGGGTDIKVKLVVTAV